MSTLQERIEAALALRNAKPEECPLCHGSGYGQSSAAHAYGCDGDCDRYGCPVEVPNPCDCYGQYPLIECWSAITDLADELKRALRKLSICREQRNEFIQRTVYAINPDLEAREMMSDGWIQGCEVKLKNAGVA